MWYLSPPTEEDLGQYCNLKIRSIKPRNNKKNKTNSNDLISLEEELLWRVNNCDKLSTNNEQTNKVFSAIKGSILIHNIHELLVADYVKLPILENEIINDIKNLLHNTYNYDEVRKCLSIIFDYDKLISRNPSVSYRITEIKKTNTCTYCNRIYTNTVFKIGKEYIERPDLDHWLCKSEHPLLAFSFYNLIPSCPYCNRKIKGARDFNDSNHIHPYSTSKRRFHFWAVPEWNNEWALKIKRKAGSPEDYMIKDFNLEEVYKFHAMNEVKDLIDFAESNNNTYLEDLYCNILSTFPEKSQADVYRMLFGTELYEEGHLNRPLSKLKHDILEQLGIIAPEK